MGRRRNKKNNVHGWLILDKPYDMTSTKAVSIIKRIFDTGKAGHAGTLDPLATGLLPIALGEATKTVPFVMDGRKVYQFTVRWGEETDTDDTEGEIIDTSSGRPTEQAIRSALPHFTGTIMQVPPRFSAIKVNGERAYDLARDGEEVELEARPITIHRLDLVEMVDEDTAVFEAECGKGTYVRAIARDLGRHLKTRGHVIALRRTVVGPFDEEDMISLENLREMSNSAPADEGGNTDLSEALLPVETALDDIPALAINGNDQARLKRGQAILLRGRDAPVFSGIAYATFQGNLIALGDVSGGEFSPKRVFNLTGQ
ncbi:tRNA pseudouridine(55) synthase TruB [Coralliovum pocilloporae]|uniref:tRNA pseudouridine(55) synthase TruB n=1 Tax=Coralliovum pocilloporae TaxID=3066369 RepID=UPI003307782D